LFERLSILTARIKKPVTDRFFYAWRFGEILIQEVRSSEFHIN